MADTIAGVLAFTAFVLMILSVLADIIFSATWTKWYFTTGVRVFEKCISVTSRHANAPPASLLNQRLHSFWMSGFTFKELQANKYAFRRKFFTYSPNPMLHGTVMFDIDKDLIVVRGYLDWFSVAFWIMLLVLPLAWLISGSAFTEDVLLLAVGYVGVLGFYGLIEGILYIIDYYRLKKIATVSVELWSRKYVRE
jgi:hypothetical protein